MTKIFVLGGTGFIGEPALIQIASRPGVQVSALARSQSTAKRINALGANAVIGDLSVPGPWQEAVAQADVVVHVAQPATFGQRVTASTARQYEADRLAMDRNLFAALPTGRKTRVVYVAGNSYYGETGNGAPKDETMTPQPTGFGPYIMSAVEGVERLASDDREVIVAFPGAVYGKGSWFKQYFLDPIAANKPVMRVSGPEHWASPILVDDCGRAIAHLALLDTARVIGASSRYFLVDDQPATYNDLAVAAARAMAKPLKSRAIPGFMLGLFAGQIIRSYMETDSKYSNAKLRATGFEFLHPSFSTGIPSLFLKAPE